MPGGMEVRMDMSEWFATNAELARFDPVLSHAMAVKIRLVAEEAAKRVKDALAQPTPEGNPSGPGRAELIAGTRVSMALAWHSVGAKVITAGTYLPADHAALLHLYNTPSFRHPVYGTSTWVEEMGHPFFEKPIEDTLEVSMTKHINTAMDEAIVSIGARL